MTRDDIIRMAREAGLAFDSEEYPDIWQTYMYVGREEIERFAALVISHHVKETRPEVADSMGKWLQQIAYQHGGIGDLSRTEMEFGAMVAAAEREACAEVCERLPAQQDIDVRDQCAAAIRARGGE